MRDWSETLRAYARARQKAIADAAPEITVPIRKDASEAPGYRDLGMRLSCIPHPVHWWDPTVIKALRKLYPEFVPGWVRWFFLTPKDQVDGNEVVYFDRLAIFLALPKAEELPFADPDVKDGFNLIQQSSEEGESTTPTLGFRVAIPSGFKFPKPTRLDTVLHTGCDRKAKYPNLPGEFIAGDWRLYHEMRADNWKHMHMTYEERYITPVLEHRRKMQAAHAKEQAEIHRDVERMGKRVFDRMGEGEIRDELFARVAENPPVTYNVGGQKITVRLPAPKLPAFR